MNAQEAFSELRALLQRPPTHPLKNKIYALINDFYKDASANERERFEAEYLPRTRDELAAWPHAALTSWIGDMGPGELQISRVIGANKLSLEQVEAAMMEIPETLRANFVGFHLSERESIWQDFDKKIRVLCENIGEVKYANLFSVKPDMFDTLFTEFGDALETLDVYSYNQSLFDHLIEHLDHLPSLRAISMHHTIATSESTTWVKELARHEVGRRLESLSICTHPDRFEDVWPDMPGAFPNLKRLRVLGLPKQRARAFIQSPELAHVQVWNMADYFDQRVSNAWLDSQTTYWTLVAKGRPMREFWDREEIEFSEGRWGNHELLDEVFFDGAESLIPSTTLRKLHTGYMSRRAFEALLEHGTSAYPNLRSLSFRCSGWHVSPEDYRAIAASPLWAQLEQLEWRTKHLTSGLSPTQAERLDAYTAWHELARDESIDLTLRRRAWETVLENTRWNDQYKLLAKAIKLEGRSRLKMNELKERFEALMPSAMVG